MSSFAEAYNRMDADTMAAAFAEDGIRVTPSGIFQGRDASCRNLHDVLGIGTARLIGWAINRYVDSTPTKLLGMATEPGSWNRS